MSSRAPTDLSALTHPLAPPSESGDAARASLQIRRGISPPSGVDIEETFLSNGIHVLSERIPSVRSAAVGVWVRQGSVHEGEDELGLSHLLEHMVFKGTSRRSARQIAGALEDLGGSLDAYTTREHTSFQARVLGEHVSEAMDVLSDLVLSPLLRDADLELEREVVPCCKTLKTRQSKLPAGVPIVDVRRGVTEILENLLEVALDRTV